MRRRIVWSTVSVVALALAVFAIPLAIAVRGLEVSRALDTVEAETEQAAVLVGTQARTLGEAELMLNILSDRLGMRFTLFQGTDGVLVDTGPGAPPAPDEPTLAAASGQVGRELVAGSLRAAVPLSSAGRADLILRGVRDDDAVAGAVTRGYLLIALGAASVLLVSSVAAWYQAQRLSRPLERLAASARRLGQGDFTARAPRADLPEADAIADALDTTAERLGRAVDRGTAFAADTSHQLRTPLTALRLHLEGLAARHPHDPQVSAAVAEADRLEATIDELVSLTRPETTEEVVQVGSIVAERLKGWQAQLSAAGRTLRFDEDSVPSVAVRPAAIAQALQVLIDNAARHGRGTVELSVRPASGGDGVRVAVRDEGPGVPEKVAAGRRGRDRGGPTDGSAGVGAGGRGLVLARHLVEAEGGTLVIDAGVPTIVLPAAT